jgi:hypothetical protein
MTNRTRSATLLGAACLVAVAGCGSDPKPKVLPSLSSTPSTTATSTTSPGLVEAEVEAAVRHYFDVANEALLTGRTGELKSLSSSECPCRDLVRQIDKAFQGGGRMQGASFRITSLKVHDLRNKTAATEVSARVAPYKILAAGGEVLEQSSGGQLRADFSLVREGAQWLVVQSVDLSA